MLPLAKVWLTVHAPNDQWLLISSANVDWGRVCLFVRRQLHSAYHACTYIHSVSQCVCVYSGASVTVIAATSSVLHS